jgi:hypothetical protein
LQENILHTYLFTMGLKWHNLTYLVSIVVYLLSSREQLSGNGYIPLWL